MNNKTVAVVGAGIAGITAAYYLAREGYSVTVFDKERYPAMKTSYANGGQISVSNSEVWTTWSNIKKGIKWVFKKDAPLLIRPFPSWNKLSWLVKFLYYTIRNDYQKNTLETIRLGLESRKLFADLIKSENLSFDYKKCGILHIYKNQKYFDAAIEAEKIYSQGGCEWKILDTIEVAKIENTLVGVTDIVGGTWTSDDSVGDIHKFCVRLHNILIKKYNVKFEFDRDITNLQELDQFDNIVVSNGVGSVPLAKTIGDHLSIYPVKGYSITIPARTVMNYESMPKVSILDDEAKIVCSLLGDRLRVAGTAELNDENYDIQQDRIQPLLNWVRVNFPEVSTRDYSSWCCLRPMTPNLMPIVKQSSKNKKVFYHTGHGHLGWTLSLATAQQLVELMNHD